MAFDVAAKANQPVVEFLKASNALILDPTPGTRTTIRKLLSSVGMRTSHVDAAEHFDEAISKMQALSPRILISEIDPAGKSGLELLEIQRKTYPNPLDAVCIFISPNNSPVITSMTADADADALIIKPFTYAAFESKFIEVVRSKAVPTYYSKNIEGAKLKLREKSHSEAIQMLNEAIQQDPKPALARYFLGIAHLEQGQVDEARTHFEEGLKAVPNHFKCLMGLFDLHYQQKEYAKSYEIGQQVTQHHTIPPKRIPDFVKVSVLNHRYEDVTSLHELVSTIENPDEIIVIYVGAALVVCGKLYLMRKETKKGIDILQKAQSFCKQRENIQVEILSTLINAGLIDEADQLLPKIPDEFKSSPAMQVIDVERLLALGKVNEAINMGTKLVEKQIRSQRLYELMIRHSCLLNRSPSVISDIVSKATSLFPERATHFESLAKPADAAAKP